MNPLKRILCTLLLLLPFNIFADQLIIEPDMGRQPIIQAMQSSKHSLSLVMYGFTDKQLLNTLINQKQNGKTIKIILEGTPYKAETENAKTIEAFNQNNIAWQSTIPPFHLVHQKTMVMDDDHALIMTFNFTHSTFKNERNFALLIDDAKTVHAIDSVFKADWNHIPITNKASNLIYSPDESRGKLISLINQAHHSLQIYAQNVSDYNLVGALAKAARRGVEVEIITSSSLRKNQKKYLENAGVKIHQSEHYYIHAKVLVIDHQKAVIGSINLTSSSLDHNRELSIITEDSRVLQMLGETFERDRRD